jgi:hypothetical protein
MQIQRVDTQARFGAYSWWSAGVFIAGYNRAGTDGGVFWADVSSGKMGFDNGVAASANYITCGPTRNRIVGQWGNNISTATNEGIFTGSYDFATSVGGASVVYGPTTLTPLFPVCMIRDNGAKYPYMDTTPSTTTATIVYSASTSGASSLHFWLWRMTL